MDCSTLPFSPAELQLFRMAVTGGVVVVATLGTAYVAKLFMTWLSWRR